MDATPPDLGRQDRFGVLACDLHDLRALYRQTCDRIADGSEPGPEVSVLKIVASDLLQRITEFNAETAAEAAGIAGDATIGPVTFDIAWQYFMSRPGTIFAGSNEIQKNILAKAVLGLPGS
jgi:alkylation response protein AidB-like acyl-CoA dehydrogenase